MERITSKLQVYGEYKLPATNLYKSYCNITGKIVVPDSYTTNETHADLLVFVGFVNEPHNNFNAAGTFCMQQNKTGKPLVGYIIFNEGRLNYAKQNLEQNINITMHELLHVLVFSKDLFAYFPKVNGESVLSQNSQGDYFYKGKNLVNVAKEHFECSTLTQLPLENEGSDGSKGNHFEATVFGNEVMVSSAKHGYKFSKFTLAVMQDSGW